MKSFLIFAGGFVAGILATFLYAYATSVANKPNDGLLGLTMFPKQGECITTTSKNKSCEIEVLQVIAPNAALATIKYYSDEKLYGGKTYRDYDIRNDVVVLLINHEGKTYYDDQKMDISKKCARQVMTSSRILDGAKLEKSGFCEWLRSLREGMYFLMQLGYVLLLQNT